MARTSIYAFLDQQGPFKNGRFPGWTLHLQYDIRTGDVCLRAIRDSDKRTLDYQEPIRSTDQGHEVFGRLADKLGADFLDLVPQQSR